jgi:hypothetical protein
LCLCLCLCLCLRLRLRSLRLRLRRGSPLLELLLLLLLLLLGSLRSSMQRCLRCRLLLLLLEQLLPLGLDRALLRGALFCDPLLLMLRREEVVPKCAVATKAREAGERGCAAGGGRRVPRREACRAFGLGASPPRQARGAERVVRVGRRRRVHHGRRRRRGERVSHRVCLRHRVAVGQAERRKDGRQASARGGGQRDCGWWHDRRGSRRAGNGRFIAEEAGEARTAACAATAAAAARHAVVSGGAVSGALAQVGAETRAIGRRCARSRCDGRGVADGGGVAGAGEERESFG